MRSHDELPLQYTTNGLLFSISHTLAVTKLNVPRRRAQQLLDSALGRIDEQPVPSPHRLDLPMHPIRLHVHRIPKQRPHQITRSQHRRVCLLCECEYKDNGVPGYTSNRRGLRVLSD